MANFIALSLQGPLSTQESARELIRLFPEGERLFEVISRYDHVLTQEKRDDHEPGDIFAFIVPFLVLHDITEKHITDLAAGASLTGGAEKLVPWLQYNVWKVFCITATYEQYTLHITNKLGIYSHNIACTPLPLFNLRQAITENEKQVISEVEQDVLALKPEDDEGIKKAFDTLFREKLPATDFGEMLSEIKPVGGGRKIAALNSFSEKHGQPLSGWVVVGHDAGDFRMLKAVDEAGGLAIAFNADRFALSNASMSLASSNVSDLTGILQAWHKGKRKGVQQAVKEREKSGGKNDRDYFHWLSGREDIDGIVETHARIRRLVTEEG